MTCGAGGSSSVSCLDVAISLGLYISERNESIFKDKFIREMGFTDEFVDRFCDDHESGDSAKATIFSTEDGKILVTVADIGHGIKKEHLDRIFEPFFSTKPVGKGTGLGLSISYGIVQQHGGNLQVLSEEGAGTTFTIALPASQGPPDADASQGNNA